MKINKKEAGTGPFFKLASCVCVTDRDNVNLFRKLFKGRKRDRDWLPLSKRESIRLALREFASTVTSIYESTK